MSAGLLPAFGSGAGCAPVNYTPGYVLLHRSGELKRRGRALWNMLSPCRLCPRRCGADRLNGKRGVCNAHGEMEIASYQAHFGEEKPLVGTGGSGTIFFSNCSLKCVFCINWEISQGGEGRVSRIRELANIMLALQERGCSNINVVTPTHYAPHIIQALDLAAAGGLRLPLVYNTCGWELPDVLRLLDGVVDIYLPDYKYSDPAMAERYSSAAGTYPQVTQAALQEMHRQVGAAHPAADGRMYRGLMIRHLVMPNGVSGSEQVIDWIADHLPADTYLNIMSQYRPAYKAADRPKINRPITREEYRNVVHRARQRGLTNLDLAQKI